jgi:hypothetical protein
MKRNYNNQIRHRSHEATNIIEIEENSNEDRQIIQLSKENREREERDKSWEILDNESS